MPRLRVPHGLGAKSRQAFRAVTASRMQKAVAGYYCGGFFIGSGLMRVIRALSRSSLPVPSPEYGKLAPLPFDHSHCPPRECPSHRSRTPACKPGTVMDSTTRFAGFACNAGKIVNRVGVAARSPRSGVSAFPRRTVETISRLAPSGRRVDRRNSAPLHCSGFAAPYANLPR